MDLRHLKVNPTKLEQGDWVGDLPDMGDLRLKVKGLGNADYRRMMTRLSDAVPRAQKLMGRIDPDEQDRIIDQCLVETVLLDWQNLRSGGQEIPYSKEMALNLITDPAYRRFRDAVLTAANVVADNTSEALKEDAGNSQAA